MSPGSIVASLFVAIVLLIGGLAGIIVVPKIVARGIEQMRDISSPRSPLYTPWVDPSSSADIYFKIYVFNLTNGKEVESTGAVPAFSRIGPYVYNQTQKKVEESIVWFANGTAQYRYHTTYTFNAELSKNGTSDGHQLHEDDLITTANYPILQLAKTISSMTAVDAANLWASMKKNFEETEKSIFMTRSAKDLFWGYADTYINQTVFLFPTDNSDFYSKPTEQRTAGQFGTNLPKGVTPQEAFGELTMWSGQQILGTWGGGTDKYANMINGTDGTQFKPNLKITDRPYVFSDALGRSIQLQFLKNETHRDVPLMCYGIADKVMEDMKTNPDNIPFNIVEQGYLPMIAPKDSVAITKPFFIDTDTSRVAISVDGVSIPSSAKGSKTTSSPFSRDEYNPRICMERQTGTTFTAHMQFQLNTFLQKMEFPLLDPKDPKKVRSSEVVPFTKNLPSTWFPLVYVVQDVSMHEDVCRDFLARVYGSTYIGRVGGIIAICLCIFFCVLPVYAIISNGKKSRVVSNDFGFEKDPLINLTR